MDTLLAFGIALLVTLFFVRHYLKRIEPPGGADASAAVPAAPVGQCPRCGTALAAGMAFCGACGAPMSLWNFQGSNFSETQPSSTGASSPRPVINASLCIGCGSCVDACPEEGALAMVSGKAILANPDRCKGHGACVPVCPTNAVTLKTGNSRQTLRVPSMDANLETNIPGLYIAGELGGMGLIKTSINEGRVVAEHIRARLASEPPNGAGGSYDVTVIGAGPAGLSASLTFHEQGVRYLALEQAEIAATIRQYPRKKFLMEEPVEMPLYGRLYIKDSSKESLLEVWETIVANTGVKIRTNEKVEGIVRDPANHHFRIRTERGEYETKYVVLAIGKRGTPRKLGVPGEESAKVVYRLIEAESYDGNDVAVVGGGDSALEAAFALAAGGTNRVTLIHRGTDFPRVRDRNRTRLAEAEAAGSVRVLREARIQNILPESIAVQTPAGTEEVPNQFVFVLIGGESPEVFLQKVGVDIIERVVSA